MIRALLRPRTSGLLFVILALSVGTGCVNLSAIREFADISAESAAYTALVDDYVKSPERQKRYQEKEDLQKQLDRTSEERRSQKELLLLRHAVIEEYMDALGQLASDEAATYDKGIDALGKAVKDNKFAEKKEADAVSAIAKLLVRAVADGWRQRKLKQLIERSDAHLETAINALSKVVKEGFAGDVKNERIAINNYHKTKMMNSSDPAGIAALEEWKALRLAKMDDRDESILAYTEVLTKIKDGHRKLYEQRNDLKNLELLRQMSRYAKELRKVFNSIKDL